MYNFTTVAQYETEILANINLITDEEKRRLIYDLIAYSNDTEAENRELRPRPDGTENVAYYRNQIDLSSLPTQSFRDLIDGLLLLVERLENEIEVFKNQS